MDIIAVPHVSLGFADMWVPFQSLCTRTKTLTEFCEGRIARALTTLLQVIKLIAMIRALPHYSAAETSRTLPAVPGITRVDPITLRKQLFPSSRVLDSDSLLLRKYAFRLHTVLKRPFTLCPDPVFVQRITYFSAQQGAMPP